MAKSSDFTPDFRALFESAPGLYLVLTPDLNIVAVSDSYLRATMTQREEITGRGIFDVFPDNPDDPTATGVHNLRTSLQRVLKNKVSDTMAVQKYDIRKPESEGGGFEERYWSPVNSPVFGPHKEIAYIIHRVEDVTEFVRLKQQGIEQDKAAEEMRTQAEQMELDLYLRAKEVQEANRRLEAANQEIEGASKFKDQFLSSLSALLEAVPEPIVVSDRQGRITRINSHAERVFGYSRDELVGRSIEDLLPKSLRGKHAGQREGYLRQAHVRPMCAVPNLVALRKDGTEFPVEISLGPVETHEGTQVVATVRDITLRKHAEEALQASEEHLRSVVETASDAIISADRDGKIIYFNSAAERIFGYMNEEVIGGPLSVLMPEHFHDAHRTGFERYLSTGEAHVIGKTVQLVGRRKDGTEFPVELSLAEWKTKNGVFFTGILSDITERKRFETALLQAKNEAERGSKFKDQFLSTMSHELRTPLNAVLGFSELLSDERYGALNEKQQRYLGHIRTGGELLLSLINDILDLSKIEAGRLELGIEEVPIEAAFAEVLSALRPLAEKKSLDVAHGGETDLAVRADAIRLKQILMNLLGNAIKFTPIGGRIQLLARASDGHVRVEVRDSGPGIPPEEQKRIFEAFYRLRAAGQAPEGTGLGLAITQRLVELQGGQLGLESEPGKGSCFYFTLPALIRHARTSKALPKKAGKFPAAGIPKILIIEDDAVAGQLIATQLSSAGYDPVICEGPQTALETAAALQPSAITLDLLMRPVTGWEILLELKNDLRTKSIPVIVVSIVDQPGVGVTLGADEYLIKPVDKEALLAAIGRCVHARSTSRGMRPILVVEDEASTREVIAEFLQSHSYQVVSAEDGAAARAMVEASLPELVILDLMLPKVSGFELLAEWRADARTSHLPVFVLTSKDLTREEQDILRSQAELLLRKHQPWQDDLLRQLRRTLPHSAGGAAWPEGGDSA